MMLVGCRRWLLGLPVDPAGPSAPDAVGDNSDFEAPGDPGASNISGVSY